MSVGLGTGTGPPREYSAPHVISASAKSRSPAAKHHHAARPGPRRRRIAPRAQIALAARISAACSQSSITGRSGASFPAVIWWTASTTSPASRTPATTHDAAGRWLVIGAPSSPRRGEREDLLEAGDEAVPEQRRVGDRGRVERRGDA